MNKTFLVIALQDRMTSLHCIEIVATLIESGYVAKKEQINFYRMESSPAGATNLSERLEVTHMCYVGLKAGAMIPLINKIDAAHKPKTIEHIVLCPAGPTRGLPVLKNVKVYQTHEDLKNVSKVIEMKNEEPAAAG